MRNQAVTPAPATMRRCRVEATAVGKGWSYRFGPGQSVDLAQLVPGAAGLTFAQIVDETWFEPWDQPPAPAAADAAENKE